MARICIRQRLHAELPVVVDVAEAADIAALYTASIPPHSANRTPVDSPDRNNLTLVFDESTGAWSKYDVGFDFLSGYRNSQYEYAILGARQGYVHEIDVGDNDGASVNEGYATLIGDVDSGGIDDIVDNSAAFQTLGDGLAGCVFAGRLNPIGRNAPSSAIMRRNSMSTVRLCLP